VPDHGAEPGERGLTIDNDDERGRPTEFRQCVTTTNEEPEKARRSRGQYNAARSGGGGKCRHPHDQVWNHGGELRRDVRAIVVTRGHLEEEVRGWPGVVRMATANGNGGGDVPTFLPARRQE
jgi:hypothetical protein